MEKQWKQWINLDLTGFNIGKYDLNMVEKYFMKEISCNKGHDCNE